MGNRTAKFVSALVGGIIAGAPLAAVSQNAPAPSSAASTASDCLAAPKGAAPQGQHWYYRLERTTKRQCWYLRAAGDKDSAKAAQTAQAPSDTPTADAPAPQQHAVQDARAEYLTPRSSAAAKTPNAPAQAAAATPVQQVAEQTADGNAQQPAATAPWPDVSTAAAPPAPPVPTVVAAPAQPGAKPSKSPSPVTLAAADSTTDKPTGSLQTLLLVIGGALALAGILGSVVYRLAGARARRQFADRHGHWGDREIQNEDGSRAPWLASTPADARPPHPIDFDAVRPQPKKQGTKLAAIGREIELIDARRQRAAAPAAEPVEVRKDKLEKKAVDKTIATMAAAPQLAANEIGENRDDAPAGHDADAVDIDVITTMLEQLAKEGPRLSRPNLEADLANFGRSLRGQSAARA